MYIAATDGRTPPRAIETGSLAVDAPAWSPDGSLIAFTGFEAVWGVGPGNPRQYVIRPDGTALEEVGTGPADRQAGMGQWSADGRRLVYIRNDTPVDEETGIPTTTEIAVAERTAMGWTERVVVAPSRVLAAALSNDGTRIAFLRMRPGTLASDLFVVGVDGTGERMVSDRSVNPSLPCWSPDDASIAVTTGPIGAGAVEVRPGDPIGWPDQAYTLFPVDGRRPLDIPAGRLANPFACSWQRLAP
jgi:Tol biopolymer transport system component